jgi:hypothetical protein
MANRFVLCGGCFRHVKACEAACPFCGEALMLARRSTGEPFRRMAAAAAVAAGVTVATGCSSAMTGVDGETSQRDSGGAGANDTSDDGAADGPSVVVFYGIANPGDAGAGQTDGSAVLPSDAGGDGSEDAPSAVAFYGIANPVDASEG